MGGSRRLAAIIAVTIFALLAWTAVAQAHSVLRALDDPNILRYGQAHRDATVLEIGTNLRAGLIRIDVLWPAAEPTKGVVDPTYMANLVATVDAARAAGMQVIITVGLTPKWASDRTYWSAPPYGMPKNRYQAFYPVDASAIADFTAFAKTLATTLQGNVLGYECWNEPNIWTQLYPQRTISDSAFAVHKYLKLLKAFSAGIKQAADPAAPLVIAGSTAPMGDNSKYRTSPQRFARLLKSAGASAYFDAYAHHPYVPGGTANVAPSAPPRDSSTTVTLQNLSVLLKLFPGKPFYLTEYGYSTSYSLAFGLSVSQVAQASYLRQAYTVAGRYPQVKALVWYQLRDWSPTGKTSSALGFYLGLKTLSGTPKRAYYAFAGGNKLTIVAPASIRHGQTGVITGVLTSTPMGVLTGMSVDLQRYSSGAWHTLKTVKTSTLGTCRFAIGSKATAYYRVNWRGVTVSPKARVLMN
jgi:hypothetical protein